MNVGNLFGTGLFGGGLIAIGIFAYSWFSTRGGKDAKFDLSNLRKMTQEKSERKIESITHEQSKIEVKIKDEENLTVEKQKAIREIADKAAEKVESIMKETDLSKLTDGYNEDLEDL